MASVTATEVQNLLRFLTQDAKIPLAEAMLKIGALRMQQLNTPEAIANSDPSHVKEVFGDDKLVKQVVNAAKRTSTSKKRAASETESPEPKRTKSNQPTPQDVEARLALPEIDMNTDDLEKISLATNRAPLFLAFAVVILEFTMPEQPLSSRLSLAQAVVSANAQTKAKHIGLSVGKTAEEQGWAKGQPRVKILGRQIPAMRRQIQPPPCDDDSQGTIEAEETHTHETFWGINLEELKKSINPFMAAKLTGPSSTSGLPVHDPNQARAYLLRSLTLAEPEGQSAARKKTTAELNVMKERSAAMLLKAIRLLCQSWADTLTPEDLDERAYSWYLTVRPDVAQGKTGWGQRGTVELAEILELRRTP